MTHKAIGEVRVKPLSLEGFAADFNAAMARTGATVRGLADELGINKSAISRVRTGKQVTQSNFIELFNWLSALDRSPTVVEEGCPPVVARPADLPMKDWRGWDLCAQAHVVAWREERRTAPSKPEQAPSPAPHAVAWMTADGRVATDETKRTAMASTSRAAFNIPLYASPLSGGDTGKVEE